MVSLYIRLPSIDLICLSCCLSRLSFVSLEKYWQVTGRERRKPEQQIDAGMVLLTAFSSICTQEWGCWLAGYCVYNPSILRTNYTWRTKPSDYNIPAASDGSIKTLYRNTYFEVGNCIPNADCFVPLLRSYRYWELYGICFVSIYRMCFSLL